MFENLFADASAIERYRNAPLHNERLAYLLLCCVQHNIRNQSGYESAGRQRQV